MTDLHPTNDTPIYPGGYVPAFREIALDRNTKQSRKAGFKLLEIASEELPHCYHFAMLVPGAKREDFTIAATGNQLSIYVTLRPITDTGHYGPYELLEKYIALPRFADPSFVSAEYKDDVLNLYIIKAKQPVTEACDIIVY